MNIKSIKSQFDGQWHTKLTQKIQKIEKNSLMLFASRSMQENWYWWKKSIKLLNIKKIAELHSKKKYLAVVILGKNQNIQQKVTNAWLNE